MHPATALTAGVVGLGAGVLAWSTLVEPRAFVLRRAEVPVLPPGSAALRVLHVTDLHLVPGQDYRADWLRGLDALEPDLVISTGDNLAHLAAVPAVLDAYGPLLHRPGAFVLGSNDYFPPVPKNPLRYFDDSHRRGSELTRRRLPTHDLVRGFTQAGWTDLDNARARLPVAGLDLELVGVDDPHLGYDRYPLVSAPAAADADLTIGVCHAPYQRVLDAMARDGAALLVAGHTHGGQVCVPFHGALVTNCDLDTGRVKGLSRWWEGAGSTPSDEAPADAAYLHVSAGLGASPYSPFRLACRPEATLLTLVPRD
ncbi:metallophosphoesterase [Ornithinimicrobium sediminis]|uniref:metallophosphoesterase n=1 Tax=Ornithinimicrobium sediminis TaxID=2904603 RepID=UPI001E4CE7D5|nr:metallophosphoesterase [Ornithinimicrobium sediminis]MCE0485864.1 metallophosphoesterase [Ornithinimicrobium sediminis]